MNIIANLGLSFDPMKLRLLVIEPFLGKGKIDRNIRTFQENPSDLIQNLLAKESLLIL